LEEGKTEERSRAVYGLVLPNPKSDKTKSKYPALLVRVSRCPDKLQMQVRTMVIPPEGFDFVLEWVLRQRIPISPVELPFYYETNTMFPLSEDQKRALFEGLLSLMEGDLKQQGMTHFPLPGGIEQLSTKTSKFGLVWHIPGLYFKWWPEMAEWMYDFQSMISAKLTSAEDLAAERLTSAEKDLTIAKERLTSAKDLAAERLTSAKERLTSAKERLTSAEKDLTIAKLTKRLSAAEKGSKLAEGDPQLMEKMAEITQGVDAVKLQTSEEVDKATIGVEQAQIQVEKAQIQVEQAQIQVEKAQMEVQKATAGIQEAGHEVKVQEDILYTARSLAASVRPARSEAQSSDISLWEAWLAFCHTLGALLPFQMRSHNLAGLSFCFFPELQTFHRLWEPRPSLGIVPHRRVLLWEICDALCRMHEAGLAHQDLRLPNIAFDPKEEKMIFIDLDRMKQCHTIYVHKYGKSSSMQYQSGTGWSYARQDLLQLGLLGYMIMSGDSTSNRTELKKRVNMLACLASNYIGNIEAGCAARKWKSVLDRWINLKDESPQDSGKFREELNDLKPTVQEKKDMYVALLQACQDFR
jgi:hypothetical protein